MSSFSESNTTCNPLSYTPRKCKFLGLGSADNISYKLYFIWSNKFSEADLPPLSHLYDAILNGLRGWSLSTDHPLAFAILHFADDGLYLLISRWNNANNIRHRVFTLTVDDNQLVINPLKDVWTIACIWEMRLIKHEVDLWIKMVLCAPEHELSPQISQNYLSEHFEGAL
jgi:hypothetical protein